jgi:hypothetical protein
MKTVLLTAAVKSPTASHKLIADTALALAGTAIEADNYDGAARLAELAVTAAKGAKNPFLTQQATSAARSVGEQQRAYAEAKPFLARLKDKPDDPAANLAVGKYLCFVKGDWAHGGPMLAKSSDPALKKLAERELANPADPAEQREIGDAWWDLAEATPALHETLQRRAAYWYRQASPKLTGLTKAKIDKRLSEVERLGKPPEAVAVKEPASGRIPHAAFASRVGAARERALSAHGGDATGEKAVAAGLAWLAKRQGKDGSWSFDGSSKDTLAATGLALMAFLGNGDAPNSGTSYSKVVDSGCKFLVSHQRQDGSFAVMSSMYTQGIVTTALCEAAGMYPDAPYRAPAAKAVAYIIRAQAPNGSWGYTTGTNGDSSIVGWQVQALVAARAGDIKADGLARAIDRADKYLDSVSTEGGAKYGYNTRGASITLTPVGLLSRHSAATLKPEGNEFDGGTGLLKKNPPQKTQFDLYYLYYATRVMFLRGGDDWDKEWNPKLRALMTDLQDHDGAAAGSWPADQGFIGQSCGRVGTTAMCALTLETYYRYPRPQKAEK